MIENNGARGKRLSGNMVKVTQQKNGQMQVTIPKGLALAYGLGKGSVVWFTINERGRLELVRR